MKLIVGLGNPGKEYEYTYHNVGYITADVIAARLNIRVDKKECESLTGVGSVAGNKIVIAKPTTYMNLSGRAVKQLLARYGATLGDLVVISDDIDIAKGTMRYRERGSAGTHNGLRNIIAELGNGEFSRLRVGTGPVPENLPLVAYVLQPMSDADRAVIAEGVKSAAARALELCGADIKQ